LLGRPDLMGPSPFFDALDALQRLVTGSGRE
jgi:hypothetical protein